MSRSEHGRKWARLHADRVERVNTALLQTEKAAHKLSGEYEGRPLTADLLHAIQQEVEAVAAEQFDALGEPHPIVLVQPWWAGAHYNIIVRVELQPRLKRQLEDPGPPWDGT